MCILKRYKQVKNYIIIYLTSWRLTSFQTHIDFSIEMLWTVFMLIQNSPTDSVLTEDTHSYGLWLIKLDIVLLELDRLSTAPYNCNNNYCVINININ